jgi:hypothetical protein
MRLILALAAHFKPSNLQQNPPAQSQNAAITNRPSAVSYSNLPSNKNTMCSNKNFAQSANNICLQNIQASQNTTKNSLNQSKFIKYKSLNLSV